MIAPLFFFCWYMLVLTFPSLFRKPAGGDVTFPMESRSRHIRTKRNKRTMRTMRVVRAKLSMATPGVQKTQMCLRWGEEWPVAGSLGIETYETNDKW